MADHYSDDLKLAHLLADKADKITSKWFRAANLEVKTKSDLTPVTQADRSVEHMIRTIISKNRIDDSIIGEEFGATKKSNRRWIIDPVDGTKNFAHGNPVYGTLIALEEDGKLIVSVVSAPQLGKRWWASLGNGAYSNSKKIHVSSVGSINEAYLSHGSFYYWQNMNKLDNLMRLIDTTKRQRAFGDFWQHMLVAEGALDIAVDQGNLQIWDMAAPKLIVQEAGGKATTISGTEEDNGSMLTSNGLLHEQTITALADR